MRCVKSLCGIFSVAIWTVACIACFARPAKSQVLTVPVPANSLVYDPVGKRIWACVGGTNAGTLANSIVSIDPNSGEVSAPVFIGSEPRGLVLSDKSKYLYTAVGDGRSIRRFDISTQKAGPQFPVGDGLAVTT